MSYEGSVEFLCAEGHHFGCDAYDAEPTKCPFCKARVAWRHSIDSTNGYEKGNPSTYPARKRRKGFTDEWTKDWHGNKYARSVQLFTPVGKEWRPVPHTKRKPEERAR